MAQNNPVGTHVVTDAAVGTRVFVGNTTPSYPTTGDLWIDNTSGPTTTVSTNTVTSKGDLLAATASNAITRLGVGTDGQVLTAASGQSTGLQWTSVAPWTSSAISANTTLAARYQYFVTTSSALTLTLPASPTQGDEIRIFDASGGAGTNNITVSPNGLNLQGSVQNLVMDVAYGSVTLVYTGSTYGWKVA